MQERRCPLFQRKVALAVASGVLGLARGGAPPGRGQCRHGPALELHVHEGAVSYTHLTLPTICSV
eukprot:5302652-Alexandrium_andersonii.AAC.1